MYGVVARHICVGNGYLGAWLYANMGYIRGCSSTPYMRVKRDLVSVKRDLVRVSVGAVARHICVQCDKRDLLYDKRDLYPWVQ